MHEVKSARSFQDGIVFYSNVFPDRAIKAYYDENDVIKTEIISDEYTPTAEEEEKAQEIRRRYMKQAGVFSSILICIVIALTRNFHCVMAAIWFSIYISMDIVGIYHISRECRKKDKKGRAVAMFHSAEHMVINAYEKLQRIPTLEEVRKQSWLSNKCGSLICIRKVTYFAMLSLIIPVCGINVPIFILLLIGLIIWMRTAGQRPGMLKVLEYFFLAKPTDKELVLAIEGIKEYDKMERKIREKFGIKDGRIPCFVIQIRFESPSPKAKDGENKS